MKTLIIIGGGIIGMTIAREACLRNKLENIIMRKKKLDFMLHQEIGVIHAGFYYAPNTKALFCTKANNLLRDYCIKKNVQFKKSGKALYEDESQLNILEELYRRGQINYLSIW